MPSSFFINMAMKSIRKCWHGQQCMEKREEVFPDAAL
tara:strand:- start:390 stop:500 length:111 start_codon:yes stop_codon:yes gene_type:complete